MKTATRNFNAWDAFVSFMEEIFFPGIIEESSEEFITFYWLEYQKNHCRV